MENVLYFLDAPRIRVLCVEGKITLKLNFKFIMSVGCNVQYHGKGYRRKFLKMLMGA